MAPARALEVDSGLGCLAVVPAWLVPMEVRQQSGMGHLHFDHHPAENLFLRNERAGPGERLC